MLGGSHHLPVARDRRIVVDQLLIDSPSLFERCHRAGRLPGGAQHARDGVLIGPQAALELGDGGVVVGQL